MVKFRVRPIRRSRLSVEVQVFDTTEAFRLAVYAEYGTATHNVIGFCAGWLPNHAEWRGPLTAVIMLPRSSLTIATIVHESLHATLRIAQRKGWLQLLALGPTNVLGRGDGPMSHEEQFAVTLDRLASRIVREAIRRQLMPPM